MRLIAAVALTFVLTGCAIQRSQEAQQARISMVGMTKEQILACMGPAGQKAVEGQTEVWSYASGNGWSGTVASATGSGTSQATFSGNQVNGSSSGSASGTAVSTKRFCTVNVVMSGGFVSAVNYSGPTGGILTGGEQCAFAIEACVKP
jgi:hypothetical protein